MVCRLRPAGIAQTPKPDYIGLWKRDGLQFVAAFCAALIAAALQAAGAPA
jgi:hypothetical protein